MNKIKEKSKLFAKKFGEAWTACMLAMVGGDVTVISLKHAFVASKTGTLTGIVVVITSIFTKLNNTYMTAWLTGIVTAMSDFIIHPTHYGERWTEAVVTGVGAGLLALIMAKFITKEDKIVEEKKEG